MKLSSPDTAIYSPGGDASLEEALARTTHLCIGAHPDDIEGMAFAGIAECFGKRDLWFSGITVTSGSGSARTGVYADYTDAEMREVRLREQRKAAHIGDYSVQVHFSYGSAEVKQRELPALHSDLTALLEAMRPSTVYLHQPADKHDTHVAVFAHALKALRALPADKQPSRVIGCEGWRNLDWLADSEKVLLDASAHPGIALALLGVFDSQNTGGKRFDLALPGRRQSNATFHDPHVIDKYQGITWGVDLTPLMKDPALSPVDFIQRHIDSFRADVTGRVSRFF
jgi:LmbE family N-acetylglucosaminyl deacetylase